MAGLGKALGGLPDLERGTARLLHRTANPAEFLSTLQALASLHSRLGVKVRLACACWLLACPSCFAIHSVLVFLTLQACSTVTKVIAG